MELEKQLMDESTDSKQRVVRRRRRVCAFCVEKRPIDYKDVARLKRYTSPERGKDSAAASDGTVRQMPAQTRVSHQASARVLALLPYVAQ